ncbi:hypothetical protein Glove_155g139 [Diversispora epigaea]|uniref:Uncharacterized protein n=1 Tax=Diversispora epigaea TaxID=1348612 RepID=A0A397IS83_9GLOM|nr:hypothetical protein Glove_155g139 [Diversispora epigaea]
MPITRNRNKKGIAILNFESQEIRDEAVGKGYKVDQFTIKIVPAETKVCHQLTQRKTTLNKQNQQSQNQESNNEILQVLEGISRKLNNIEENINYLNERVDAIQYGQSNISHINQERVRNQNNLTSSESERESPKQLNNEEIQEEEMENNTQNEITQYLSQIMNKLDNMENQHWSNEQKLESY